jgi:aminomethyltransferase
MLKTPLNAWHHAHKARMVDFAGWEMPVQYSSIVEEHNTVRNAAGLFDISHMGRLEFRGESAGRFLNRIVTNDTSRIKPGGIRYALVCREDGGILDDVLVYHLPDRWFLVVNASNRDKIVDWLRSQPDFNSIEFEDLTLQTAMIAVQGPESAELVSEVAGPDIKQLKYYSGCDVPLKDCSALISRTGYTGEDGFEFSVPAEAATGLWEELLRLGASRNVAVAGLGCRDTLRLEAAMPLYGHELSESIDPLTAGLAFAVKLGKEDGFIGCDALQTVQQSSQRKQRVGLEIDSRRIAREGSSVQIGDGSVVGEVTSGTFSPTLQRTIAMAYVEPEATAEGTKLQVEVRGSLLPATVVALPFYKRRS